MKIYDLEPLDGHKSFYGKAKIVFENGIETLFSYDTPIARHYEDGHYTRLCDADVVSVTTSRHISAFTRLNKSSFLKLEKE